MCIRDSIYTARVLEQAPVIVFVVNTKGMDYRQSYPSDKYMICLLYTSRKAVVSMINGYIYFYNNKRIQRKLHFLAPMEVFNVAPMAA